MNVLILSDHDAEGGAALAACRVEASVERANLIRHAWLSLFTSHDDLPGEMQRVVFFRGSKLTPLLDLWDDESLLKRQLLRLPRKVLPRVFPRPNTAEFAADRLRRLLHRLRPDIINVHNLHGAAPWGWGPHLIEVCLEFAPVVWTLHDMWSFTGRCAYSYECEKFIGGCDASCPTPHEEPKLAPEKIRVAWEERRAIYDRHVDDLVIVTPSRWLAEQARRGLFAQQRIEVIPYGVEDYDLRTYLELYRLNRFNRPYFGQAPFSPEFQRGWLTLTHRIGCRDTFVPVARADARRALGIQPAGPVLLVAAVDLRERRKGADILPQLWRHIEHRPLTVITMGRGTISIDDPLIEVNALGYIEDDEKKALAYSAADALLHPAPVDNFPNVVLEALACGTPTIALPVGGLPELVRPGVSGWLATSPTAAALGQAVDRAVWDLALGKSLRESCRNLVDKEYSMELQGWRYLELFRQVLKQG